MTSHYFNFFQCELFQKITPGVRTFANGWIHFIYIDIVYIFFIFTHRNILPKQCFILRFLDLIQDHVTFSSLCFISRAVGAIGGASVETSTVVILTQEFPENVSFVVVSILPVSNLSINPQYHQNIIDRSNCNKSWRANNIFCTVESVRVSKKDCKNHNLSRFLTPFESVLSKIVALFYF